MTGSELLALAATGIGGLLLVAIAVVGEPRSSVPSKRLYLQLRPRSLLAAANFLWHARAPASSPLVS
jgi:hypothetical protein